MGVVAALVALTPEHDDAIDRELGGTAGESDGVPLAGFQPAGDDGMAVEVLGAAAGVPLVEAMVLVDLEPGVVVGPFAVELVGGGGPRDGDDGDAVLGHGGAGLGEGHPAVVVLGPVGRGAAQDDAVDAGRVDLEEV